MAYYYDRYRYVRIAGIALCIILLLFSGYYLYTKLSKSSLQDIVDIRQKQIELYEKLLETNPSDVETLIKLGNLYKEIGNIGKAIGYYNKALAIEPHNYNALNELGHAYALQGDYENAIKTLELAKKYFPKYPQA